MPNSHPAAIAGQILCLITCLMADLTLELVQKLASDAEIFVIDKNRNEMFVECIDMVLDIWRKDPPYNLEGKYWKVSTEKTLMYEIGQYYKKLFKSHTLLLSYCSSSIFKRYYCCTARGRKPISQFSYAKMG